MDKEHIRVLIENSGPAGVQSPLFNQLKRMYEEYCNNEKVLNSAQITPQDIEQLKSENQNLNNDIKNKSIQIEKEKKYIAELREKIRNGNQSAMDEIGKMKKEIQNIEEQCAGIRLQIDELDNKPAEADRLKAKLDNLTKESNELQAEIDGFSEEEQKNMELTGRLTPFVENLESLEKRMELSINEIWNGFRKDSFDKMY